MKVLISISFTLAAFSLHSTYAKAPWQTESSRRERDLPWKNSTSEVRKEKRESFFKSLSLPFSQIANLSGSDNYPKQESSSESAAEKSSVEIESLPWKSYQKEWNLSYDSIFLWPVKGGKISSGFGIRNGRFHEGLDITAKVGAPIQAIGNGRVVYSGTINGYGHTVVIYHGGGISSVYAHNRENLVRVGDLVEKSQAVATLGATGHVTGPHVHFEIRKDGEAVNPLRYRFKRDWSSI